jgi:hypothetical protein
MRTETRHAARGLHAQKGPHWDCEQVIEPNFGDAAVEEALLEPAAAEHLGLRRVGAGEHSAGAVKCREVLAKRIRGHEGVELGLDANLTGIRHERYGQQQQEPSAHPVVASSR